MSGCPPHPDGLRYAQHWEPVLADSGWRLLDRVAALAATSLDADAVPGTVLDLGSGAGLLALAAAERWPLARVVGLDASDAMLSVARQRAAEHEPVGHASRLEWLVADAAAVPLQDASVDVVVSSFMLQLVADRQAVLREVWRVLRAGGMLGLVTWLADELWLAADTEFDEAVYDLSLDDAGVEDPGLQPDDYESPAALLADLEAAGLVGIDVQTGVLESSWSREAYLDFKEQYDEFDLFESLAVTDRARLRERVAERWQRLPEAAFSLRTPIVWATARRPSGS
jgi:SAM-dependent methyltransferase